MILATKRIHSRPVYPVNVEAFVRAEGLIGRFKTVCDIAPGTGELLEVLQILGVAENYESGKTGFDDPSPAIISFPIGYLADVGLFQAALAHNAQYLAMLMPFYSVFFQNRIEPFRINPPSRLFFCHVVALNNVYTWLVWDGQGKPISTLPPEPPRLFWTSPEHCRTFSAT